MIAFFVTYMILMILDIGFYITKCNFKVLNFLIDERVFQIIILTISIIFNFYLTKVYFFDIDSFNLGRSGADFLIVPLLISLVIFFISLTQVLLNRMRKTHFILIYIYSITMSIWLYIEFMNLLESNLLE